MQQEVNSNCPLEGSIRERGGDGQAACDRHHHSGEKGSFGRYVKQCSCNTAQERASADCVVSCRTGIIVIHYFNE